MFTYYIFFKNICIYIVMYKKKCFLSYIKYINDRSYMRRLFKTYFFALQLQTDQYTYGICITTNEVLFLHTALQIINSKWRENGALHIHSAYRTSDVLQVYTQMSGTFGHLAHAVNLNKSTHISRSSIQNLLPFYYFSTAFSILFNLFLPFTSCFFFRIKARINT